jgi:hypothetical protein
VLTGLVAASVIAAAPMARAQDLTFTPTGPMAEGRYLHTLTTLAGGTAPVAGGCGTTACPTATAEIYDPATGTFSMTGAMTTPRLLATATRLADGRVRSDN